MNTCPVCPSSRLGTEVDYFITSIDISFKLLVAFDNFDAYTLYSNTGTQQNMTSLCSIICILVELWQIGNTNINHEMPICQSMHSRLQCKNTWGHCSLSRSQDFNLCDFAQIPVLVLNMKITKNLPKHLQLNGCNLRSGITFV